MTRRGTEQRIIAGKRVRVERGTIAARCAAVAVQTVPVPLPDQVGPTAIDCGHALRFRPMRFPTMFFRSETGEA